MKFITALSVALLSAPALAMQMPDSAKCGGVNCDPHVRVVEFQEHQSVLLTGAVGRPMVVTFAPDEVIFLVNFETPPNAGGRTQDAPWQSLPEEQMKDHPLSNVLPLWTMSPGRSSLQVVTANRDKGQRVYYFQLMALPRQPDTCGAEDCDDPRIMTGVQFVYPHEVQRTAVAKQQVDRQVKIEQAAADRLIQDIFYGKDREWRWIIKGKEAAQQALTPSGFQMSSNGQATAFVWPGRPNIPAVYIIEPDGTPRTVAPDPKADGMYVVWETAKHWRFIQGQLIADIVLCSCSTAPTQNPHTGTTSPNVVRTPALRSAQR